MSIMKPVAFAFVTLAGFSFGGCGKHQAVKEIEAITDKVCACKDLGCARDEAKASLAVIEKYRDEKAGASDHKAILAAAARMKECVTVLEKAQR